MEVDPIPMSSSRVGSSKKAKTTHGALLSKEKGKRLVTGKKNDIWSLDSSDSSSNSDATQSNSDNEE